MDEGQLRAARRVLSKRTADGKLLSAAESVRLAEERFDQSGLGELLEKMPEKYIWKQPDPTASEMRRFIERDFGQCLINTLRDVGVTLGFMTFISDCPPVSAWLNRAGELATIPEGIKEKLLHIDGSRRAASYWFPSLDRIELDGARKDIVDVMVWLRNEFPAAGVEYLPDDFGR